MRHRKSGVKLNRTTSHRQAMFRNMVTSLLKHDRIQTTEAKAKELRRWADHIITLAKRGDLHARRQALSIVREKNVVHKIFDEATERFGSIHGGYTRIVKIGRRAGDAAPMTVIELISADSGKPATPKKAKPVEEKTAPVVQPAAPVADSEAADAPAREAADEPAVTEETADNDTAVAEAAETEADENVAAGDAPAEDADTQDDADAPPKADR